MCRTRLHSTTTRVPWRGVRQPARAAAAPLGRRRRDRVASSTSSTCSRPASGRCSRSWRGRRCSPAPTASTSTTGARSRRSRASAATASTALRRRAGSGRSEVVVRWLIELVARYVVVSHVKNVVTTMRNLYWVREMEAPSDSREFKLLRPARFDAEALVRDHALARDRRPVLRDRGPPDPARRDDLAPALGVHVRSLVGRDARRARRASRSASGSPGSCCAAARWRRAGSASRCASR